MDISYLAKNNLYESTMRDWRKTVEVVLFEVSNSMKPYPSVFQAHKSKLRPVIFSF